MNILDDIDAWLTSLLPAAFLASAFIGDTFPFEDCAYETLAMFAIFSVLPVLGCPWMLAEKHKCAALDEEDYLRWMVLRPITDIQLARAIRKRRRMMRYWRIINREELEAAMTKLATDE